MRWERKDEVGGVECVCEVTLVVVTVVVVVSMVDEGVVETGKQWACPAYIEVEVKERWRERVAICVFCVVLLCSRRGGRGGGRDRYIER